MNIYCTKAKFTWLSINWLSILKIMLKCEYQDWYNRLLRIIYNCISLHYILEFCPPQSNLHSFDYKTKHLKIILLKYIIGRYRVTTAMYMHFMHIGFTGLRELKWGHYSSFFNLAKQVTCNLTVPERQPWLQKLETAPLSTKSHTEV